MKLEDAEDHACPGVVQVAEWIRNFTDMSAGNCTFKFRWKGEIYCVLQVICGHIEPWTLI